MAGFVRPKGDHVLLLRGLPVLIEIGLLVYCLIDAIQTPGDEVRNLGKTWWLLLIAFVPVIGGIAWLVAGRPNTRRQAAWRDGTGFAGRERPARPPVVAPDDDPEFLERLGRVDREQEDMLRNWEADLRDRETHERDGDDRREPDAPA
jgi:hypothetical protein